MLTALVGVVALLGLPVGAWVNRAAGAYPWPVRARRPGAPVAAGGPGDAGGVPPIRAGRPTASGPPALRPPVVELATAALFALTALRFGAGGALPAFLLLAAVAVLLALVDARHRLLPDAVVLPALVAGVGLLALAAAVEDAWPAFGGALLGAGALFAGYLALALLSPGGLGMGDVKLAALLGLHLGWLGWGAVVLGTLAAFVAQALLALVLLASRRVGLRGELPFGPAMLAGAALAVAGSVPPGA